MTGFQVKKFFTRFVPVKRLCRACELRSDAGSVLFYCSLVFFERIKRQAQGHHQNRTERSFFIKDEDTVIIGPSPLRTKVGPSPIRNTSASRLLFIDDRVVAESS